MSVRFANQRGALLALLACAGCGPGFLGGGDHGWLVGDRDTRHVSTRSVQLRWRTQLTRDQQGSYVPVERATAALDPGHDRVYVGTSAGELVALNGGGGRIYAYNARGGIASEPVIDPVRDELFVGTEDGVVHSLTASTGALRWRAEVGGAVTQSPLLTDDAIYVATDNDLVVALDREAGEPLWRYRRDAPEGFYVSHHAGLALSGSRVVTGFTAGVVVALSLADGALHWERDTSVDLEPTPDGSARMGDVDTTPLIVDDLIYVASFAGGLYALEAGSGTVAWRDETMIGVTGITRASDRLLLLASGDLGVVCYDRIAHETVWRKELPRGAPAGVVVASDLVLFGESQGGFITAALADGQELGRIEAGHGFSATAAVADGRGFVLDNGGILYAFALPPTR